MELAGEDTTFMLISDHGFHPDENRPVILPKEPSGPAVEHSPYGIIVMNGPDIKKDELIFGASLLDITPTLLALYGLPVAEDMDGKVLIEAFNKELKIETIKSWENIKGPDGRLPSNFEMDQAEMNAELQQLIDLGYVEAIGDDMEKAIKKTRDENNYYLARSYFDGGKWEEGIELLAELNKNNPDTTRYAMRLAHGYLVTEKSKEARQIINQIKTFQENESPEIDLLEGTLLFSEGRFKKALALFKKVEQEAGGNSDIYLRIANAYLKLNKLEAAEAIIKKALLKDKENVHGWYTLGLCYYRMMNYENAVDALMSAIGLIYYFPQAHFYLGETLVEMGRYEDAASAFDVCLKIAPSMNIARQRLISVYEQYLHQPGKAFKYRTNFENNVQGNIVIVSGLPRSGTSMMMQMLEAGGLEVFTDKQREADESNPKGYYEHEAVKSLQRNKEFLKEAKDKVVKVIVQLLPYLPMNYKYQIVFMERNLYEVIASQQKMLIREGKRINDDVLPVHLIEQYENTLKKVKAWAQNQPNVSIHFIDYKRVVQEPFMQSMLINDFFNGNLEVEKMATAIESKLYRTMSDAKNLS